ncbi:SURF1 family protein [Sphingomonas astaxanthinifaciens]|uniref:SURF1-like protein n=1 Tax=Sphingomonas astaxanthinifaciens DSM 22298 TaxID=1123267 RepID=A0ABQ5Z7H4_9SPHN|nr:SURF1 family protein [Sphingomonas astaxanthinifaciens]GLR47927.1 hypothetical protein GCM10007925_16400 [Sphingomonas astaxanthinifaciens DSM 22298]
MRRVPLVATLVVLLAVAAMVGLGLWQVGRAKEKEALLARFERNVGAPRTAVTPGLDLSGNLLRPVSLDCARGSATRLAGAGKYGFRVIAECTNGSLGRAIAVQLGTTARPTPTPAWPGGRVEGYLGLAPDSRSLLRLLTDHRPAETMIVADPPLAGLAANPGPDLSSIPNNHRSYAVQWFAFAAIALVIYALALRSRWRRA